MLSGQGGHTARGWGHLISGAGSGLRPCPRLRDGSQARTRHADPGGLDLSPRAEAGWVQWEGGLWGHGLLQPGQATSVGGLWARVGLQPGSAAGDTGASDESRELCPSPSQGSVRKPQALRSPRGGSSTNADRQDPLKALLITVLKSGKPQVPRPLSRGSPRTQRGERRGRGGHGLPPPGSPPGCTHAPGAHGVDFQVRFAADVLFPQQRSRFYDTDVLLSIS